MDNNTTQIMVDLLQHINTSVVDVVRYQADIWLMLVLLVIVIWVYILVRITWAGKGRR